MKTLTTFLSTLFVVSLQVSTAFAGGEGWISDFAAAKKQAAAENKAMLVDFTGSDWCGWCIKLNEEVFSHDEFKEGVKDTFVLVEIDYPQDKKKLSKETILQNEELKDEYEVKGYPTILLMDAEGRPFAQTGYQEGGALEYVKSLNEMLESKKSLDASMEKAGGLEGPAKAQALVDALETIEMEESLTQKFYGKEIEEIKAADPDDTTGFQKEIASAEKYKTFEAELETLARKGDFAGSLTMINKTLEKGTFEGEMKQQVTMIRGFIQAELGQWDEAIGSMDEAKAIAPEGQMATALDQYKTQIEKMKEAAAEEEAKPAAEETTEEPVLEENAEEAPAE